MAVAFDATAKGDNGASGGTSVSFTLAIGAGVTNGAVAVGITMSINNATGITVTVGGTSATLVSGTDTGTAQTYRTLIYTVATGSATGNKTVSVSWTTACSAVVRAVSASGVDQTTPMNNGAFHTQQADSGGNPAPTLSITSNSGDLTFDYIGNDSGTSTAATAGGSQTARGATPTRSTDFASSSCCSTGAGAGTQSHTWTWAVGFLVTEQAGANFKAASGVSTAQIMAKGIYPDLYLMPNEVIGY